jgi:hypothetical protein
LTPNNGREAERERRQSDRESRSLQGRLVGPGDPEYDAFLSVHNGLLAQ